MASPAYSSSQPTSEEILLSRLLEKTLRRSSALDVESLCLLAGSSVWSIRADVHVLSSDGNLVDCACVSVIAALVHFRKPDTEVTGGKVTVYTTSERDPVPLSILHWPFCVTFNFYGGTKRLGDEESGQVKVLLDVTRLEEQLRDGACTIGMNRHAEICQIAKLGGVPVDAVQLLQCTRLAEVKVKEMANFVKARLDLDAKKRDRGGLMAQLSAENDR